MMSLFLTYELKVAVLIAVFYIFWRLLVANETWHRLNRIVLLSTALASFCIAPLRNHHSPDGGSDAPCGRYAPVADRRDGYAYGVSPCTDKRRNRMSI